MAVKKISIDNKTSAVAKKSILQQVMKPKDWLAIGVLVVVSAVCWLWVLNAYQQSINVEDFVSGNLTNHTIDKS